MIKVLIVEDSPVMQQLLIHTINSDNDLKVVGTANNGREAIEAVKKFNPDVVAMDWHMPELDGKEATRIIMETNPKPIVIVTASIGIDVLFSFSMIEAGALAIVKKPPCIDHPDYKKDAHELIQTLKLMSEVKLVKRMVRITSLKETDDTIKDKTSNSKPDIQIIAIGASTGGPIVLQKILLGLPKNFSVPILIVQHISDGFTKGFVDWLNSTTSFPLHIASHGDIPKPGHGYVAPDNQHMGVDENHKIILSSSKPENGLRPSVAFLFRTIAQVYGSNAVGILLTGMGRDGAEELKLMKGRGAITFVQDKESSIVHGMPGEAIKLDAAMHILSPIEISKGLVDLIKNNNGNTNGTH
jgi:two-component system chemotaxis response regulator CheB